MFRYCFLVVFSVLSAQAADVVPLTFRGENIEAGTKKRMILHCLEDFTDPIFSIPALIVHGSNPGPRLAVTAGVHGDELNGMEIARRLYEGTDPKKLAGSLVILPVINYQGFLNGSRYLTDRRDLNRHFPGDPKGSMASILADEVFQSSIVGSDALIDLHCASNRRVNLPQIRVDYDNEKAVQMACHFGVGVVVHGAGPEGSLRRDASDIGIPSIIYETGSPHRFEENEITLGLLGLENVMRQMGMLAPNGKEVPASEVFSFTQWVRAPRTAGGNFLPKINLGAQVTEGQLLGHIIDPVSGVKNEILAPEAGRVIGMSIPTIIFPGEALFHLGLSSTQGMSHPPQGPGE